MTWIEAYDSQKAKRWANIDRVKFISDFMYRQYENIDEAFDIHGDFINKKATLSYFNMIRRGHKAAKREAVKYAEDFFQINR